MDATPRSRRAGLAALAVAALAIALSACVPSITIETNVPTGPVVTLTPVRSGVTLYVVVPSPRTGGPIEVVTAEGRTFRIPPGHLPPRGQCRYWDPDLPPGRQSLPGACGALERRVPRGSYLIYG